MYTTSGCPSLCLTTWASQILSNNVLPEWLIFSSVAYTLQLLVWTVGSEMKTAPPGDPEEAEKCFVQNYNVCLLVIPENCFLNY
ncbi:MAG: hypothetical protein M3Y60_01645, partial [Bacteroidota bacterium]|nr:hypothetical protein [Bacteroidota bacterium]